MIAAPSNQLRRRSFERIVFWSFRIGTYFVLLCATYIFLDIGIKGGRTVFQKTAPFVNVRFLTEPPQTLYVFDYQGKKMELSDRQFREWKTTHKEDLDVTSVSYSAGGIWPCIVGTARNDSSLAVIIAGRTINPSVNHPESSETFHPKKITNNPNPKSPNTIEGTPARLRIATRISRIKRPSRLYSLK